MAEYITAETLVDLELACKDVLWQVKQTDLKQTEQQADIPHDLL